MDVLLPNCSSFITTSSVQQKTTGELSTPPAAGVKGHRLVFVEAQSARALASSFPPAIVMLTGKRLVSLSQKQQSRQKKLSFTKKRGGSECPV